MKTKSITANAEPSESEIQHAAYLIWLEDGQPEGRDLEHWLTAKEMLCHRHGRDATTRQKAIEVQPRQNRAPAPRSAIGSRAGARNPEKTTTPALANHHH